MHLLTPHQEHTKQLNQSQNIHNCQGIAWSARLSCFPSAQISDAPPRRPGLYLVHEKKMTRAIRAWCGAIPSTWLKITICLNFTITDHNLILTHGMCRSSHTLVRRFPGNIAQAENMSVISMVPHTSLACLFRPTACYSLQMAQFGLLIAKTIAPFLTLRT